MAFDWNQVRAFLATVEEGSLSAAARALGQTQPTLGRQVTALEEALNVTLFERAGRSLQLTSAGVELVEHVRAMGEAANRISLTASGQNQTIEGQVKITASDMLSSSVLPKILAKLAIKAPRLRIDVIASNDIRDILRREADIAIRHVRPEQPDLIARLIREMSAHFYASRTYLKRHGHPRTIEELSKLDFIGMGDSAMMIEHYQKIGMNVSNDSIRYSSADGKTAWELARHGLGILPMDDELAAHYPDMEVVVPELVINFPLWLTTHRELHTSRRIRLVFDHLAEHLAKPG